MECLFACRHSVYDTSRSYIGYSMHMTDECIYPYCLVVSFVMCEFLLADLDYDSVDAQQILGELYRSL